LGLLAKAQIITFPCLLLLWDYWPLQRMFASSNGSSSGTVVARKRLSWLLLEKLPLFALSIADAAVTIHAHRVAGALNPIVLRPLSMRLENAVISYLRYMGKAFWPSRLTILYPYSPSSIRGWQVFASSFILLLVSLLVIRWHHLRYLLVGWFWFIGALLPMIGIVYNGEHAMADRYAYLSFLGLFIMVCWGAADWARERQLSSVWLAAPSLVALLALAAVAHRQIYYWNDDLSLWSHALAVTSNNWVAEDHLGAELTDRWQLDAAMPHFRAAAAIYPLHPLIYAHMGYYYQQRGDPRAAIEQYQKVIALSDNAVAQHARLRFMTFENMADAYRALGDYNRATECLEAAKDALAHAPR
jgi:hypothetical protein